MRSDFHQRGVLACDAHTCFHQRCRDQVRRHLDRGDHLTGLHRLPVEQSKELQRIDGVKPGQSIDTDVKHSIPFGREIEPALTRRQALKAISGCGSGQPLGGIVLVDISRLGPPDSNRDAQLSGRSCFHEIRGSLGIQRGPFPQRGCGEVNWREQNPPGQSCGTGSGDGFWRHAFGEHRSGIIPLR